MNLSESNSAPLIQRTTLFYGIMAILVCMVVGGTVILHEHGYFHLWLNLGNPLEYPQPGEKVVKILGASPRSIRVGTNHSRAFETDLTWIAWRSKPKEFPWHWHEAPYEIKDINPANFGCPYSFWVPPLLPGLFVATVDHVSVKNCRMYVGIEQADYVILADGKVWVWESQRYVNNE